MSVPTAPAGAPFVGRARERDLLRDALTGLTTPPVRGGTVVVVAEAGAGKTRLVAETLPAAGRACPVLCGGAVEIPGIEVAAPYGIFNEALRGARRQPQEPAAREALDAWFAAGTRPASVDPGQTRRSQLLDVLAALCADRPHVLVLEDLHWADPSSLSALVLLARSASELPMLVVATSREPVPTGPLDHVLTHLTRAAGGRRIDLPPLPDTDGAALVRALGCPERHLADVLRLAEGNPLALVELAGAVPAARPGAADSPAWTVPDGVRSVVAHAWSVAGEDVRTVLAVAALIGPATTPALLTAVLPVIGVGGPEPAADLHRPHRALEQALATGLLEDRGDRIGWRHALHRSAVHALVVPSLRDAVHTAIAAALEAGQGSGLTRSRASRLAEIAAHRALAGEPAAAARAHLAAGDAAYESGAFPEALAQYDDALRAWERLTTDPTGGSGDRVRTALRAAECARWVGEPLRGLDLLAAMLPQADDAQTALLQERIGGLRREVDDGEGAAAAYARAVVHADRAGDVEVRATVLAGLAAWQLTRFQFEDAARSATSCLEVAADPSAPRASALNTLGVVRAFTGAAEDGIALLEQSYTAATDAGSEPDVWRYLGNLEFVYQNLGRTRDAVDLALAARDRARRTGVSRSPAVLPCLANGVSGLFALGRWDEAVALGTDILGGHPPAGQAVAGLQLLLAELHTWRGDATAALPQLEAGRAVARSGRLTDLLAQACRVTARMHALHGDVAAARGAVDEALALLTAGNPISVVEVCLEGLRLESLARVRADATVDECRVRDLAHRVGTLAREDADHALEPGEVALARAFAAQARGRTTVTSWSRAVAALREAGTAHQLAEALLYQGEALLADHARGKAGQSWRAAAGLADDLGLVPLGAAVRAALRRARLPAGEPPPTPAALPAKAAELGLTQREVEVLEHLTHGRSNRQIARALRISERTVGVHVSSILGKLGVTSRSQAAAAAHATQLLADTP